MLVFTTILNIKVILEDPLQAGKMDIKVCQILLQKESDWSSGVHVSYYVFQWSKWRKYPHNFSNHFCVLNIFKKLIPYLYTSVRHTPPLKLLLLLLT